MAAFNFVSSRTTKISSRGLASFALAFAARYSASFILSRSDATIAAGVAARVQNIFTHSLLVANAYSSTIAYHDDIDETGGALSHYAKRLRLPYFEPELSGPKIARRHFRPDRTPPRPSFIGRLRCETPTPRLSRR